MLESYRLSVRRIATGVSLALCLTFLGVTFFANVRPASSADPQKELAGLGITWSAENFRLAVFRHNYRAVELFLQGGIDPHTDPFFQRGRADTLLTTFAYDDSTFDQKIADLLMEYPRVIDPVKDCPTSAGYYGSNRQEMSATYARVKDKPEIVKFLKFFCNKPEVLAKIDVHIAELKKNNSEGAIKGWRNAKSVLTGQPPETDQPQSLTQAAPVVPLASNVVSSPIAMTDPAAIEVVGVKLGMTPDQAVAALKSFEPRYVITKLYKNEPKGGFNDEGVDISDLKPDTLSLYYLNNLTAIDSGVVKPETRCVNNSPFNCNQIFHDDYETVKVWFSPVSGKERVIAVTREKIFHKEPKPVIATLVSGVLTKYAAPPTYQRKYGDRQIVNWIFDPRRGLMSSAAAKSKHAEEMWGIFPRSVSPGDGVILGATFVSVGANDGIASQISLSLLDPDALYKSIAQSKLTYASLKAKSDANEIEKASKNQSQTKF